MGETSMIDRVKPDEPGFKRFPHCLYRRLNLYLATLLGRCNRSIMQTGTRNAMNTNASQQRRLCALATFIGVTCWVSQAGAQSAADRFPEKPIKIVVPFSPGGSVDVVARVIGQKMQERWGQPVVIESRPGASALIGTTAVAKSPADGYTLIVSVSSHTTNPAMRAKMPYDTLKDFASISLVALAKKQT